MTKRKFMWKVGFAVGVIIWIALVVVIVAAVVVGILWLKK